MGLKDSRIKVFVYDGSLSPPVFIQVMINQIVKSGIKIYLVGSGSVKNPVPKLTYLSLGKNGYLSIVTALIISILGCFPRISVPLQAIKYVNSLSVKQKLKDWIFFIYLLRYNPDIVHIQWAEHLKRVERYLVKPNRAKLLVSLRGRMVNVAPRCENKIRDFYNKIFPKIDFFHAVSNAIGNEAELYNANPKYIRTVYSGIEAKKITQSKEEGRDRKLGNGIQILSVGRFHWKKGYNYAIEAMNLLKKDGINFHYTLISPGVDTEFKFQILDLGLDDIITIIPGLSHSEVLQYMNDCDIFLLPSLEEGIANVVLEAMSLGSLVISTDCGGMKELIRNDENGYLVPVRDSDKIACTIKQLVNLDETLKERVSENAIRTIENYFTSDRLGEEMINLYEDLVDQ